MTHPRLSMYSDHQIIFSKFQFVSETFFKCFFCRRWELWLWRTRKEKVQLSLSQTATKPRPCCAQSCPCTTSTHPVSFKSRPPSSANYPPAENSSEEQSIQKTIQDKPASDLVNTHINIDACLSFCLCEDAHWHNAVHSLLPKPYLLIWNQVTVVVNQNSLPSNVFQFHMEGSNK